MSRSRNKTSLVKGHTFNAYVSNDGKHFVDTLHLLLSNNRPKYVLDKTLTKFNKTKGSRATILGYSQGL